MPSRFISFKHQGHSMVAEVIFNFSVVEDVVLVMPVTRTKDLNENIPFTLEDQRWVTKSPMIDRCPGTISNIQDQLQREFCGKGS